MHFDMWAIDFLPSLFHAWVLLELETLIMFVPLKLIDISCLLIVPVLFWIFAPLLISPYLESVWYFREATCRLDHGHMKYRQRRVIWIVVCIHNYKINGCHAKLYQPYEDLKEFMIFLYLRTRWSHHRAAMQSCIPNVCRIIHFALWEISFETQSDICQTTLIIIPFPMSNSA